MPGGFGTMDEFFETLTLIQTKKTENFPLILFGVDFYKDLISQFDKMKAVEAISEEELKYVLFTDSIDEAKSHIEKYVSRKAELMREIKIKPIPIFGEKAI
jgi:predicted Rossmann-fold nucleotide-binding protein